MKNSIAVCLLLLCSYGFFVIGENRINSSGSDPLSVEQQWVNMEKNLKKLIGQGIKVVLPMMMEGMVKMNISASCTKDTMKLISGAKQTKSWAMKIIGANSGILVGIAFETGSAMGAYDQCINTEAVSDHSKNKGEVLFRGKYCTVDVKPPLPPKTHFYRGYDGPLELKNFSTRDTILGEFARFSNFFYSTPYRIGLCVPSGCSENDISQLAEKASELISMPVSAQGCEMKEENKFTPLVIAILCAYGLMILLVILGTLADHFQSYISRFDGMLLRILLTFSLTKNFSKLCNISTSSDVISCLNGMKFLGLTWIVLGHTYSYFQTQTIRNAMIITRSILRPPFVAVTRSTLGVDTFFFLSGTLVCIIFIKSTKESKRPFNLWLYIFHRIWRLLPSLVFVIGFVFLLDLVGSGPIWYEATHDVIQGCYDNWWTNILFFNNFYFVGDWLCLEHTWYLASDLQLYIFALVILLPLSRWPKVGVMIAIGCILTSMVVTAAITLLNDYPADITISRPDKEQVRMFLMDIHIKPYVHAGVYCIGILSGYLLVIKSKLTIPKTMQALGWCIFATFLGCTIFGITEWNSGVDPTPMETLFFSSCSRVTFALALAWMVICCATGHGGVINEILSWKVWTPLGRLTYLVYLIHPLIQNTYQGILRTEQTANHIIQVWQFFGHVMVSYGIAFFLNLTVEAPFISMEKIFLYKQKDTQNSIEKETKNSIVKDEGCITESI